MDNVPCEERGGGVRGWVGTLGEILSKTKKPRPSIYTSLRHRSPTKQCASEKGCKSYIQNPGAIYGYMTITCVTFDVHETVNGCRAGTPEFSGTSLNSPLPDVVTNVYDIAEIVDPFLQRV